LEGELKQQIRDFLILVLLAGIIVIADQLSKTWIQTNIPPGDSWMPFALLAPYVRMVHWYNTGVAFGMFQGMGGLFTVLAFFVAGAIIYYYPQIPDKDWLLRISMGMLLGGALGNLVDRLTIGHVIDFISIGTFPVFNIADSCISVGVGVLLLSFYVQDHKAKKEKQAETLIVSEELVDPEENPLATRDPVNPGENQK
jgi:signal peptidase II